MISGQTDSLAREARFTEPYETLSMDDFLANMLNPLKIQAILDTKSVNAHDPVLIGCVVSELYWIYP